MEWLQSIIMIIISLPNNVRLHFLNILFHMQSRLRFFACSLFCLASHNFLLVYVGPGMPSWIWLHNVILRNHSKNIFVGTILNAIKDLIESLPTTNWFKEKWWKSGPISGIKVNKLWVRIAGVSSWGRFRVPLRIWLHNVIPCDHSKFQLTGSAINELRHSWTVWGLAVRVRLSLIRILNEPNQTRTLMLDLFDKWAKHKL